MQYYIASPQEPSAGQGYTASNFETKPPISDLNKKYNLIEHRELPLGDASIYKALEESPQASSLSEPPALDHFSRKRDAGEEEAGGLKWLLGIQAAGSSRAPVGAGALCFKCLPAVRGWVRSQTKRRSEKTLRLDRRVSEFCLSPLGRHRPEYLPYSVTALCFSENQ